MSGMRKRSSWLLSCLAIVVASGHWPRCWAQSDLQTAEYKVKAAFLYKFASYIEWPSQVFERPESPIVIGVAGADPLNMTGTILGGTRVPTRRHQRVVYRDGVVVDQQQAG